MGFPVDRRAGSQSLIAREANGFLTCFLVISCYKCVSQPLCFVILWNKPGDFLYFSSQQKTFPEWILLTCTAGLATDTACGKQLLASNRLLSKPLQDIKLTLFKPRTSLPMRRLCIYVYGFDARWTRIASGQRLALDGHRRAIATSWLTCLFLAFRLPAVHASYELQAAGRWSLLR